jgi:hypothetical protein
MIMDRPLLNDKSEYPNDDVLLQYLGKGKSNWDTFVAQISSTFAAMTMEWNFYNDGKSWLCKLVYKKKTVCWISVWEKYFKTTFYFTDKNTQDIKRLEIDKNLKSAYLSNKSFGKLKPLTVDVKTKKALTDVFELIRYKSGWKA